MERSDGQSKKDLALLAKNVERLSLLLTTGRTSLPEAYLSDGGLRSAYVAYYLPANLSKIHTPLHELSLHGGTLCARETIRVLDLGCGPGTASLGLLEYFAQHHGKTMLEFTAVDQVSGNLKEAEALFLLFRNRHAVEASFKTIQSDIAGVLHAVHGHFDVIVLSNVVNELFGQDEGRIKKRVGIVAEIMKRFLTEEGSCIIIDPALRETSRDLLQVRDGLLDQGLHVYSPCLAGGRCPALANPKDWCHQDIPWDPPLLVQEIDALTGLRKDSLKFSYLVMRKDGRSLADICGTSAFRVVSDPLVSKGKRELFLCNGGERKLAIRLDKDATTQNVLFEQLRRGSVITFENVHDEGKRFKIGKDTAITITFSGPDRVSVA